MINLPDFQTIIDTVPNPVIITNGKKIKKSNTEFLSFFNYETLEDFNKHHDCVCDLFISHEDSFSLENIDTNILWTDYIYTDYTNYNNIVYMINKDDGKESIFKITINKVYDKETYIVVFTDVTAIKREAILLEKMALTDYLTNIYNRKMFKKMLKKEKEDKKRHGDHLSLIMLDIDHFKNVNDTHGHDVGDKVLITLTKLISENLRVNDIFARWGGEEFMILLPRTDVDNAYHKAQELRRVVEKYSDDVIPKITVSFGVTEILDIDKDQSCFIRVDEALYSAKIKRNDVVKI